MQIRLVLREGCLNPALVLEDSMVRRATLDRIKPMAWKALEQAVAQLDAPSQPGLHTVHLPSPLTRACW